MSIPEIRLFQFGGNNVNLFRGDVNSTLTLVSMPSRSNLDVNVSIFYKSNIHDQAFTWNLDAPTGIVGLGWSLPYERIEVQIQNSAGVEGNTYYLVSDESSSPLLASEEEWLLLQMDIKYKEELNKGEITYQIREEFAANSLLLSEDTTVKIESTDGPWWIYDNQQERIYKVVEENNSLSVLDGGYGFELQNYQFWKIRYYSDYEKWLIVKENGLSSVYGGGVSLVGSEKSSQGNSIQWGVRWGNWIGSSTVTEGQQQYALAWNLSSNTNLWGDKVKYIYELVEQQVGDQGLFYTKASYLSSIVDVFGRQVLFDYKEKEFGEFMDPHKATPNNIPNAYQDRYETKYLNSIEVKNEFGDKLFSLIFKTEVRNVTGRNEGDPLYKETSKRFLTDILHVNHQGNTLPGVKFDYYWASTDPHPGALKKITNPQGGISTYTYRQEALPLCRKDLPISKPSFGHPEDWIPRVWFGPDYALVAWFNVDSSEIEISLYMWLGYWYKWTDSNLTFKSDLDIASLNVVTQNDFCALSYNDSDATRTTVLILHKLQTNLGQWLLSSPQTYSYEYYPVHVTSGSEFVTILNQDNDLLDRFSWDWRTTHEIGPAKWNKESFSLKEIFKINDERDYYLSAKSNFYILLAYDLEGNESSIIKIFYQDNLNNWHEGGTAFRENIYIGGGAGTNFFWSLGDTFAVATYITFSTSSSYEYTLQFLHWDEKYQFTETYLKENLQVSKALQFLPIIIQNSLLGSGPYLFRFNGKEWQEKEIELEILPGPGNIFWFSYGSDLALVTQNSSAQIISLLGVYDPNTDSLSWESEPLKLADVIPPDYRQMRYFPTTGFNLITLDKKLYYRGSSTNWVLSTEKPMYEIPTNEFVDTTTIYNQSPSFLSYLKYEDNNGELNPIGTVILNLRNGNVDNIESFDDERIFQIYNAQGYLESDLNGRIPTGPDSLVTYKPLDKEWDEAETIILRRALNAAVEGLVTDYSVISIETDDGFNKTYTAYDYDLDTAVCDPSGKVIKYYKVRIYPGSKDKADAQDGYTETVYINGLPGDVEGVVYPEVSEFNNSQETYSALDGFIESQNTYDAKGELVASQRNDWLIKTEKTDQQGKIIPIRGSYALLTRVTNSMEKVITSSTSSYDLFSGQIIKRETTNYNSRGNLEKWTEHTTYGYQVYPLLGNLNIFPLVAQKKIEVEENIGTTTTRAIYGVQVTRFKSWQRTFMSDLAPPLSILAINDNYQWNGGEGNPNFTAWQETEIPSSDWQRGSTIISRNNKGLAVEVQDIMGKYASTLYDKDVEYEVATFSNARILKDEADYIGFESYEQDRGWKFMPSGESWASHLDKTNAHTGHASLTLSASTTGDNALEKTFIPATQNTKYLFAYWYKTNEGFTQKDEEAGWQINLLQNGNEIHKIFLPFENTKGEWKYVSQAIDLTPYAQDGNISIQFRGYNKTSTAAWLDDIRFSPFKGDFSANIYDAKNGLLTASLGPYQETNRNVYDNFRRTITTVGPAENVSSITTQYLSRQQGDVFSSKTPNADISITGREKGFYSDFIRDGGYELHWSTTEKDQWSIEDGALLHSGTLAGSISLISPAIEKKYAVYLSVKPYDEITQPIGIRIGNNLSLKWEPSSPEWVLEVDGSTIHSTTQTSSLQQEWLLVIYDKTILFFADGEKLFATVAEIDIEGIVTLFAGNKVAFSRIILSQDVQIGANYLDGGGKQRQSQMLYEEGSIISQTVYDYLSRPAVETKPALLSPTTEYPLLSYRSSFVDSLDWDSGIMKGEVSTYYSSGGGGFSDDEGYPYSRSLFESSPLGRVIEQGLPGKEFAITNLKSTKPEDRHTTKTFYFSNTTNDNFISGLPEHQYFITKSVDPDGKVSLSLEDQSGNAVGQGNLMNQSEMKYILSSSQGFYTNTGKKVVIFLPNYFDPPDPETKENWQTITEFDMLGREKRAEAPNVDTSEIIYDLSGTVRFSQSALGRQEGYYAYAKYDEIGRLIEDGIFEGTWDREQLQKYASEDPSWPSTPSTWGRILSYDGDGSDPTLMGRLASVTTHGDLDAEQASTQESYRYDIFGNVIQSTLEFLKDNKSYSTFYTYDVQGNIKKVEYPFLAGKVTSQEITYTYDQGGLTKQIGNSLYTEPYAAYFYNADGSLQKEVLAGPFSAKTERIFTYNSPGWVTQIKDSHYQQNIHYTKDTKGDPGYYTGLIAEEEFKYIGDIPSSVTPSYSYRYHYDELGRLTVAKNSVGGEVQSKWSIGLDDLPLTYDSNGNISRYHIGSVIKDYVYEPGTDKLKNTDNNQEDNYTYNLNGALLSAKPKKISSISYNRASGREDKIVTETDELKFEYNSTSQRILKSSTALSKLYLYGLSSSPLIEEIKEGTAGEYPLVYVYGLSGLIGFIKDEKFNLILSDRQGSTRLFIQEDGTVKGAYTYLPFGEFMDDPGDMKELITYLYTSQEWEEELKLYNYKARFYDPSIGRFYNTDVAGQFASPYLYAANNPIMFIDPSGNMATGAGVGIGLGVGLAVFGAILSIFTLGASTPVLIGGLLTAGASTGGGISSITYSAMNSSDEAFDWGAWGANFGIGLAGGALSAGAGAAAGAAVSAATSAIGNFVGRAVLTVGAGIIADAAVETATNVLSTVASNAVAGLDASTGLGTAAWTGAAGGALGGLLGGVGIAGARLRAARNYKLTDEAIESFTQGRIGNGASGTSPGGRSGIWDSVSGDIHLDTGDVRPGLTYQGTPGWSSVHAQQALYRLGPGRNIGIRNTGSDGLRPTYPGVRGFSVRKVGPGRAVVSFNSQTLNGYRGPANALPNPYNTDPVGAWLDSPAVTSSNRIGILSGLRSGVGFKGIRPVPLTAAGVQFYSNTEKLIAFFLRTPFP